MSSGYREGNDSVTDGRRLSICYAAPGHFFLPEVGPTCNALAVAQALSQVADVTLAFRKVIQPQVPTACKLVELDATCPVPSSLVDDSAVRGTSVIDLARYLLALRKFVKNDSSHFDVVLEKSWLLSGYLTQAFQGRGVPGVLVENLLRMHDAPLYTLGGLKKFFRHCLSQIAVRHYARKAPMIIAETSELRAAMIDLWGIAGDRVEVVELGVDATLFHPMDQGVARRALGIDDTVAVLLYVGVLDRHHNIGPVIEALSRLRPRFIQFHVLGDGLLRRALEETARHGRAEVFFHGRVPHTVVPQFIAAADLCLAPYEPRAFHNGSVSFATLKVLEYLACGRPVVSVPSGHILKLIRDGINGFLFPNEVPPWMDFLRSLPQRGELKQMGVTALETVPDFSWEKTAAAYLRVCERVLQRNVRATVARTPDIPNKEGDSSILWQHEAGQDRFKHNPRDG